LQDVADFNALGGPPEGLWTINEAGQVGFMVRPGQSGFPNSSDRFTIYRSDGGVATKLAETTPFGPAGTFATFSTTFVSINDSGTVSFWAQLNGGGSALYRVDSAGTLSTAVDTNNGFFTSFYADARMNQSGVIAFGATTTTGLGIFTVAPDGTLSTIVTRPSDFEGLGGGPAINSAGTVAFLGQTKTIRGVFTGKGGALTTIAQATREFGATDPFLDFTGVPAINDAGTVVFQARLRSAPENGGIFTGPNFVLGKIDPTAVDKVIAIGDALFGSTVETLYFNGALNQNGDIAFSYGLKNRIEGVAFAWPLPTGLANISTRLRVQPGDNALIGGFIITGTESKKVLLRAIAPSLNVPGKLADPTIELFNSSGQVIRTNDNWGDSENKQAIIASTIPPGDSLESAILVNLDPGAYTAIVRGVNNTTGIGVVEAYDLDRTADSKFANISTRGVVETGDDVMIAGFIIVGSKQQNVIVRAIGPSLSVDEKLGDPTLALHDGNGVLLRSNNDWRTEQEADIIATTIPPGNDVESAIVTSLLPGPYTAIVRGVNDTTGIAVVEVYALQ
jgi:hypothetical protein